MLITGENVGSWWVGVPRYDMNIFFQVKFQVQREFMFTSIINIQRK